MTHLRSQFLDKLMSIYAFNSQEFSSTDMSKALGEALHKACDLGYFDSRILVEAMQGDTADQNSILF